MALTAVLPAMNHDEQKSLHPFFSKPQQQSNELTKSTIPNDVESHYEPNNEQALASPEPEKIRKKRSRQSDGIREKKANNPSNQGLLHVFARKTATQHNVEAVNNNITLPIGKEQDSERGSRKRQKTSSPEPAVPVEQIMPYTPESLVIPNQSEAVREADGCAHKIEQPQVTANDRVRSPSPARVETKQVQAAEISERQHIVNATLPITPKKQIKITKSGKLVSSPPKPIADTTQQASPKRRRGRPRKNTIQPTVTIIRYGNDAASRSELGTKIEAILNGPKTSSKQRTTPKRASAKAAKPMKNPHPFFTGKKGSKRDDASKPTTEQKLPTPKKSAVTPGKLRTEALKERLQGPVPSFGMPLGPRKAANQSGLHEASWPNRDTAHVRNLLEGDSPYISHPHVFDELFRPPKSKRRALVVREEEDIISRLSKNLSSACKHDSGVVSLDFAPPEGVRLPGRLLTTGPEIQRRVGEQIKALVHQSGGLAHPAVTGLFADIEQTLTPFDEGRCESQSWAQKYSPKSSSHVLQIGKEALFLRDWLRNLTVMAVGGSNSSAQTGILDVRKPQKKKRKRAVDDFIVSDEEDEADEMVPLSSLMGISSIGSTSFCLPKWSRHKNVILISGPPGCGKSAAVYAVAKELGFEIFEINSGTRRSGRDIQERVGDMTANHLVNHKRDLPKDIISAETTDTEQLSSTVQEDIDNGRQGTMMSFFKAAPSASGTPKPKVKLAAEPKAAALSAQATLPVVTTVKKSQKQSLILFEEADILFEEDQQFWAQVTRLASQSKRPIVITCNNEEHVPMGDLPLAAMLRLRPPPIDLATDYMLALAGREGHILEREAVADLYMSKSHDLRASITELDFWCQMSVGDKKGGLEWMYQRWPPGKDTDAKGRLLRVASEHTYQSGMGYFSHNVFEATDNPAFDKEEELLQEIWQDWGLDPSEWTNTMPCEYSSTAGLGKLLELEKYTDAMSATDVHCRVSLPAYDLDFHELTDPSQPDMTDKARLSHTLARPLLQIDHQANFLSTDTSIYTQTLLLAGRVCRQASGLLAQLPASPLVTESDYAKAILTKKAAKITDRTMARLDFSVAFDIIAAAPDYTLTERTSFNLTPSSFDRAFKVITRDLAPYVRSIVAHEQVLEEQRVRLSSLLSQGGTAKRARTTRASRVALEGGVRETKRRDRWFDQELDFQLVMATAGKEWSGMGWRGEGNDMEEGSPSVTGTQESVTGSQDTVMHDREVKIAPLSQ